MKAGALAPFVKRTDGEGSGAGLPQRNKHGQPKCTAYALLECLTLHAPDEG